MPAVRLYIVIVVYSSNYRAITVLLSHSNFDYSCTGRAFIYSCTAAIYTHYSRVTVAALQRALHMCNTAVMRCNALQRCYSDNTCNTHCYTHCKLV